MEISLLIEARDLNALEPQKQITTCKVVIFIQRNRRIIFDRPLTFTVKEEQTRPDVFSVTARIIGEPSGTLLYEILPDTDPHRYFEIDRYIGSVEIRKRIDYEEIKGRKHVTFQVLAYSNILNETVKGETNVTVNIEDVNDNVPIFTKDVSKK